MKEVHHIHAIHTLEREIEQLENDGLEAQRFGGIEHGESANLRIARHLRKVVRELEEN